MIEAVARSETVGQALARCRAALVQADIESPALEARLLVAAATAQSVEQVIAWPERRMTAASTARLDSALARRLAHQPMAHILGRREFWSLDLGVSPDVLIPRPDSETLVAAVLEHIGERTRALTLLDLGTGSGCLLLALLSELPNARGVGVDRSAAALAIAGRNAGAVGLQARATFREGDWSRGLDQRFDVVVSNPPYIPSREIAGLAPEVRREPALALDGGADGLEAYRAIAADLGRIIQPGGLVALEIGAGQAEPVEGILRDAGLEPLGRHADLSGVLRCLTARPSG